jgi:hypothetical protein
LDLQQATKGRTVAETLWKCKPAIGGACGGIALHPSRLPRGLESPQVLWENQNAEGKWKTRFGKTPIPVPTLFDSFRL